MMKKIMVRNVLAVSVSLAMVHALAAPAMIGIATAKGSFRVDDSYVAGNATLFDGATVETGVTSGEVSLSKTKIALDSGTRARVFQNHVVLDQGKIQWSGALLRMQAGSWQVGGADGTSTAIVVRKGDSVVVGALTGTVNVMGGNGRVLKTVPTGLAFAFSQEPAGDAAKKKADDDKLCEDKKDGEKKDGDKKKEGCAAVVVAAGAGAAAGVGAAAGAAGLATGAVVAIGVGVAAAVAIPVAVVATRNDSTTSDTVTR